jgi:UDP-N-acetylmuramate--alanine ligase
MYFIGAGGIGMSALVRYFLAKGKNVAGYDRTSSTITERLTKEGAPVHYDDDMTLIPAEFLDKNTTAVVYTPAVNDNHSELTYFRDNGFEILKRAEVLGLITQSARGICVAGTHGKTTTSSMTAHILKQSHVDCNAFLGGILKNYDSNLMLSDKTDLTVIEADEYDRSFHRLTPYISIITSADPDHLDVYGTPEAYRQSFEHYTSLIRPGGALVMKKGVDIKPHLQKEVQLYTYSATDKTANFYAENIRVGVGEILFDLVFKDHNQEIIRDIQLGVPVRINIENAVAAMAVARLCGVEANEMKAAMASFGGAERRFDFKVKTDKAVYIDDYAHHPEELRNAILSVKELYKGQKVTGIFQPHLYTRTRDFADDFAQALSLLDTLILLPIYPAREEPIEGITSEMLLEKVNLKDKTLCEKDKLLEQIKTQNPSIIMTLGAGDIDRFVPLITQLINEQDITI